MLFPYAGNKWCSELFALLEMTYQRSVDGLIDQKKPRAEE